MNEETLPNKKLKVIRDKISQKTIDELNRLHNQLVKSAYEVARLVIELGEKLAVTKKQVKYGDWTNWVEKNLTFPMRTVQRYMKAAEMKHSLLLDSDPAEFMAQIWGNTKESEAEELKEGKKRRNVVSDEGNEDDDENDEGGGGKQYGGEGPAFNDKQKFIDFKSVAFELDRQFFLHLTISVEEKLNFIRELRLWLDDKEQILLGDADAPENEEL